VLLAASYKVLIVLMFCMIFLHVARALLISVTICRRYAHRFVQESRKVVLYMLKTFRLLVLSSFRASIVHSIVSPHHTTLAYCGDISRSQG